MDRICIQCLVTHDVTRKCPARVERPATAALAQANATAYAYLSQGTLVRGEHGEFLGTASDGTVVQLGHDVASLRAYLAANPTPDTW